MTDPNSAAIYMVTWIPSIYPSHVSIYIYTSTMDPMGYAQWKLVPMVFVHHKNGSMNWYINGDFTKHHDDLAKNNDVDNRNYDLSSKSGDFTNKLRDLSKNFLGICQTKNGFVSTKKSWPETRVTMVKINYHLNKKKGFSWIFCTVSMNGISSDTRSPAWVFWRVNVPLYIDIHWLSGLVRSWNNPAILVFLF